MPVASRAGRTPARHLSATVDGSMNAGADQASPRMPSKFIERSHVGYQARALAPCRSGATLGLTNSTNGRSVLPAGSATQSLPRKAASLTASRPSEETEDRGCQSRQLALSYTALPGLPRAALGAASWGLPSGSFGGPRHSPTTTLWVRPSPATSLLAGKCPVRSLILKEAIAAIVGCPS